MWNGHVVRICLAHGSCACSTRASQDLLVLPKRHDNRLFNDFFLKATNKKAMLKLFCPLHIFNLRIQGLIWRGIAYFVQNDTAASYPTSKLPCGTPATHFGATLEAWTHKLFRIFHYFSYFSWFWELWILFSQYLLPSPVKKVTWFQCYSCECNLTSGQYIFPDCWILVGQVEFQAHEPYAWWRTCTGVATFFVCLCNWMQLVHV